MKDILERAQNYLDSGGKVPEELLREMSGKERETLAIITDFQNGLEKELDSYISEKPFVLDPGKSETGKGNTLPAKAVIFAAAAVFLFAAGIPVYKTAETNRMIKQETRDFVASITDSSWAQEMLPGDSLSSEWFNPEPAAIEIF